MAVPIFLIIVPVVFFLFLALSIGLSVGLRGRCGFNSGRGGYRRGVVLPLAIASQQQRQQQAGHQGQVSYIGANQGVPRGVAPPPYSGQQPGGYTQPGSYPATYPGQAPQGYPQKGPEPGPMGPPPPDYSYGGVNPADAAYPPPPPQPMPGVSQ